MWIHNIQILKDDRRKFIERLQKHAIRIDTTLILYTSIIAIVSMSFEVFLQ